LLNASRSNSSGAGILLNRRAIERLDTRISALEASLRGEITAIRNEIAGVRGEIKASESSLRGEMNAMRTPFHSDLGSLLGRDRGIDVRLARLEERKSA